jgi:hypothetical protein
MAGAGAAPVAEVVIEALNGQLRVRPGADLGEDRAGERDCEGAPCGRVGGSERPDGVAPAGYRARRDPRRSRVCARASCAGCASATSSSTSRIRTCASLARGGAIRDCPLSPEVASALDLYLTSRAEQTKGRIRREDPVWLNNRGDPLTPATLDHHVRQWYRRAGVPLPTGAATHAFRHTVAMQLINRGEPVSVAQELLGHASLSSTQIYIRAAGHHVREAAHALPIRHQLRKMSQLPAEHRCNG